MLPKDIFLYLIGNRGAIERIAGFRIAWVVGAILVLTAGIARNYDHLDLLREPEAFYGPFLASIISTEFIYWWVGAGLKLKRAGDHRPQRTSFLGFVWLTAPCAWVYAIPVEHCTDMLTATKWNVAFLAIVSFWRVAILTRVLAVLTEVRWTRCLLFVLAPASLEMAVGSWFKSLSLIGIMGGVRLSPHTEFLVSASDFTLQASIVVFLVCLGAILYGRGKAAVKPLMRPSLGGSTSVIGLALVALVGWMLLAIPMQQKVRNLHIFGSYVRKGDLTKAAEFASSRTRADFPVSYAMPPDPYGWGPKASEVLNEIPRNTPEWLRKEWRLNRLVASAGGLGHSNEWRMIARKHPDLNEAVLQYAAYLRGKPERTVEEDAWLVRFDAE